MRRLISLFAAHPWPVMIVLLAISAVAATQLHRVEVQISAEELLVMDDPERRYFEEVRERFGDEKVVLVFLEDDLVLGPRRLNVLKEVVEQLESLSFVEQVHSLFTVPHLKSVDGYLERDPYLAKLPETDEAAFHLVDQALTNPFVRHVLLSEDGRVMALAIVLAEDELAGSDFEVTEEIDTAIAGLREVYEQVFAIGFPQVRSEIANKIRQERGDLFPLAVAALLIALFLLLRHLVDILAPILTASLSVLWTLGLMGLVGIPLNVVTSIVPILLIVVGSTEDIHLLAEFRHGQRQGIGKRRAIDWMGKKMGRTVLLTFITTYAGFLSVGLSRIEVLWQFGLVASTGLLLNFVITVALIPALLSVAGGWKGAPATRWRTGPEVSAAQVYWQWLFRYRRFVLILLGILGLAAAAGIPQIQVNHNAIDNLAKDSRVRAHVEEVNANLSGLESFSIVVDSGIEDTFLKVRYLDELVEIQNFISDKGVSRSTTSFADYLALLNGVFFELDHAEMPENDDEVFELMIFLDYTHVSGYVSEDYSTARILVRHSVASTADLQAFIDELNGFIDTNLDPGLEARITGDSVLTLSATRSMIGGQLQSILILLFFIMVIVAALFTDVKVGLLAAVPNAFPVVVLFGFMGYAGIPLNIGTTMAAAIAIGIAVDDTMHFLLRYNQELATTKSESLAMHATLRGEALPVVATSVALVAGFLVFAFSDFEPVAQFGILSALVIATALVADFVVTPLAISSLRLVTLWDMLSLRIRQQVIPQSPLFRGMRPWQIRMFVLSSTLVDFAPDDYVFHQEEASDELYLVMTGLVEVRAFRGDGSELVTERFESGQVFGEIALLAKEQRKTDAIAVVPTTLLVLTREVINSTTQRRPGVAARLFLNLATDISKRWVTIIMRSHSQRETADSFEAEEPGGHGSRVSRGGED
ncbi:MAG: MMPL family transporter [Pseudomonadota bacterium]